MKKVILKTEQNKILTYKAKDVFIHNDILRFTDDRDVTRTVKLDRLVEVVEDDRNDNTQ